MISFLLMSGAIAAPSFPTQLNTAKSMCHTAGAFQSDAACKCLVSKDADAYTMGVEWMAGMGWYDGGLVTYDHDLKKWYADASSMSGEYTASQTSGTCWNVTESVVSLPTTSDANIKMEAVLALIAIRTAPKPFSWHDNALFNDDEYKSIGDHPDEMMSGMLGTSPIQPTPHEMRLDTGIWNVQENFELGYQAIYQGGAIVVESLGGKTFMFEGKVDGDIAHVGFIADGRGASMVLATTNGHSYVVEDLTASTDDFLLFDESAASLFDADKLHGKR